VNAAKWSEISISLFPGPPISEKLTALTSITTNFVSVMSGPEEFHRVLRLFPLRLQIRHSNIEHLLRVLSRKRFSCREPRIKPVHFPCRMELRRHPRASAKQAMEALIAHREK
jgi:hypothetical protein